MKRNSMRIAALLLVLVLLTTAAVGGTFAKYVSKAENTDQARAAYWGFDATNRNKNVFNLFDPEYVNKDKVTVKSADGADVYAPGTKGETSIDFVYVESGNTAIKAPEVAYTFDLTATLYGSNAQQNEHLSYYVQSGENKIACADENEVMEAIVTLLGVEGTELVKKIEEVEGTANYTEDAEMYGVKLTYSAEFAPGELPDFMDNNQVLTIGWEWVFEKEGDSDNADWDRNDTQIGNQEWFWGQTDELYFEITVGATQVD